MKYIGVSTPAWTFGQKLEEDPCHDRPVPQQYKWDSSIDKIKLHNPTHVLYSADRKTWFGEMYKKKEKAQSAELIRKPKEKRKKVQFNIENQNEEVSAEKPFTCKLGFFNKTKRFKLPPPECGPDVGPQSYEKPANPIGEVSMEYKYEREALIQPKEGLAPDTYHPKFNVVDKNLGSISYSRQLKAKVKSRIEKKNPPGPGDYEHWKEMSDKSFHSLKGTMGKGKRELCEITVSKTANLGPGLYTVTVDTIEARCKSKFRRGFLASGEKRSFSLQPSDLPSPGQYYLNTDDKKKVLQGGVITRAKRFPDVKQASSGGEKSILDIRSSSESDFRRRRPLVTTFGTAIKNTSLEQKMMTPGPGQYELNLPSKKPCASFGFTRKYDKYEEHEYPGPGQYDLKSYSMFFQEKRKGVFKGVFKYHKPTPILFETDTDTGPGPLDYKVNYSQVDPYENSLGTLFAREKRYMRWQLGDPEIDTAPGLYVIKSTIPQVQPFETPEARDRGIRALFG